LLVQLLSLTVNIVCEFLINSQRSSKIHWFLINKKTNIDRPLTFIYSINIPHSRFPSYLTNICISLLKIIIFNFYSRFIAHPNLSILWISSSIISYLIRVIWNRWNYSMNSSGFSILIRWRFIARENIILTSVYLIRNFEYQLTSIGTISFFINKNSLAKLFKYWIISARPDR
jgi:hypothetical protein